MERRVFDMVVVQNKKRIIKDLDPQFKGNFKTPGDFLEVLIKDLIKLTENNFKCSEISNESSIISETVIEEFIRNLSKYMEKNLQNKGIDYPIFAFTVLSFAYFLNNNQKLTCIDHEEAIEKFVNNCDLYIY